MSDALLQCHKASVEADKVFELKVFVAGRNRLENEGATALAGAFNVNTVYNVNVYRVIITFLMYSCIADLTLCCITVF